MKKQLKSIDGGERPAIELQPSAKTFLYMTKTQEVLSAIIQFEDMENCSLQAAMDEDIVDTYEEIEAISKSKNIRSIILKAYDNPEMIDKQRLIINNQE